jgi:membrane associated rhomboid family serine protease
MDNKAQFFPLRDDNPVSRITFVNWALIAINVIIFVISLSDLEGFINSFGFIPASFSFLTLFSSMFLHGSVAHIIGNMWFLYIFGDNIEDKFGHLLYPVFYILAGITASLAHMLLNLGSTIPAVGASGAISGVLGAYLVMFPKAGVHVAGRFGAMRVSAWIMLALWFGFQLFSGISSLGEASGIAFFAHIGGFLFGVFGGLLYRLAR